MRNISHVYEEHVSEAASKEIKVISHCPGVQSRTHATSLIYFFCTLMTSKCGPGCVNGPRTNTSCEKAYLCNDKDVYISVRNVNVSTGPASLNTYSLIALIV